MRKATYAVCPICGKYAIGVIKIIKSKRGTTQYYHYECIQKEQKELKEGRK